MVTDLNKGKKVVEVSYLVVQRKGKDYLNILAMSHELRAMSWVAITVKLSFTDCS